MDDISFNNGLIIGMASAGKVTGNKKKYEIGDTILSSNLTLRSTREWVLANVSAGNCVAVDSTGNIYVTFNNFAGGAVIRKVSPSGQHLWYNTEVGYALSIAVDHEDNLYVGYSGYLDTEAKNLRKLDSNGNEIWHRTLASIGSVRGIKCVSGNVYVVDGRVHKINPSTGASVWTTAENNAMALDANSGGVYVNYYSGTTGGVFARKFTINGGIVWEKTGSWNGNGDYAVQIDLNGDIYFSRRSLSDNMRKFSPTGEALSSYPLVYYPRKLAIDNQNNLYVGISNSPRLQKFSPAGVELFAYYSSSGFTTALVVDKNRKIYIIDDASPNFYLHKIDAETRYLIKS